MRTPLLFASRALRELSPATLTASTRPERSDLAHRVPVGQRLLEATLGTDRARELQQAGEHPLGQSVADHDQRSERQDRLDRPLNDRQPQQRGGCKQRARVQDHALSSVIGVARDRRPGERQQRPQLPAAPSPISASRPPSRDGSGRGEDSIATTTSAHVTSPAHTRGPSK